MKNYSTREEKTRTILSILCISALFLVLIALVYPRFGFIGTDGVTYVLLAKNIVLGHGFEAFGIEHTYFSPLTSLVIAPFFLFLGDMDIAGHAMLILCSLGSLILTYLITLRITDRSTAMITGILFASNFFLIWENIFVVAQPLALFLSLALVYLLVHIHFDASPPYTRILLYSGVMGFMGGLLYLVRPEYIFIIVPIILFLIWYFHRRLSGTELSLVIVTASILFALTILPYILFLHQSLGEWTITGRLHEQYLVTMDQIKGLPTFEHSPEISGNPITLYFKSLFSLQFYKTYVEFFVAIEQNLFQALGLIGIMLFGVGLLALFKERVHKRFIPLLIPGSIIFALALGHTGERGYLVPFLPLFIIVIAFGIQHLSHEVSGIFSLRGKWQNIPRYLLVLLTVASFSFILFQNYFFRPPSTYKPVEYQLLGEWFRKNVPMSEREKIGARKPEIPFYVGTERWLEVTGDEPPATLVEEMRQTSTKYLVLDSRSLGKKLESLVNKDKTFRASGLELLHEIDYYDEYLLVYKIVPQ